jgi:hypothetical protein
MRASKLDSRSSLLTNVEPSELSPLPIPCSSAPKSGRVSYGGPIGSIEGEEESHESLHRLQYKFFFVRWTGRVRTTVDWLVIVIVCHDSALVTVGCSHGLALERRFPRLDGLAFETKHGLTTPFLPCSAALSSPPPHSSSPPPPPAPSSPHQTVRPFATPLVLRPGS